jgi:hypothetical protein
MVFRGARDATAQTVGIADPSAVSMRHFRQGVRSYTATSGAAPGREGVARHIRPRVHGCRHCPYEPQTRREHDEGSRMNEWLAFGTVAVICGLLAALTRWAGSEGGDQQPPDTPAAP